MSPIIADMFTHVVVFWTKPEFPQAAEELLQGIEQLLKPIPGYIHLSAGKMAPSTRPVVDQSYQIALCIVFADRKAQDDYQVHPGHQEFARSYTKRLVSTIRVFDFE